jgi:hypothetical protein
LGSFSAGLCLPGLQGLPLDPRAPTSCGKLSPDVEPAAHLKPIGEETKVLPELLQSFELGVRLDLNRPGDRVRLTIPSLDGPLLDVDLCQYWISSGNN